MAIADIVKLVEEKDANDQVGKVYDDIKQVFGLTFVPNLFKAMVHHPAYLETTWVRSR